MRRRRNGLLPSAAIAAVVLAAAPGAGAQEAPSFKDKTVILMVGSAPGGGTDGFARIAAAHLGEHLPGKPLFVVRNMPGAGGVVALNYFVKQVKPDGLTLITGSNTDSDPVHYRTVN